MVGPTIPISRIHICHECDPKRYPRGKPIMPEDTMARKDENAGEWICGTLPPRGYRFGHCKGGSSFTKGATDFKEKGTGNKTKSLLKTSYIVVVIEDRCV